MITFRHGVICFRRHQWHPKSKQGKQASNQSQQSKLWPFSSTQKSTKQLNIQESNTRKKSSMGKNSKNGENHTWAVFCCNHSLLVAVCFSTFFLESPPSALVPQKNPPISFPFLLYIYHPSRPKFLSKKENSPILSFFFSSLFLNLPIKSNLPNFKFPSKTFQGESRLP